jgi:phospholipid/cholesterol/gamma-HCH transport system substrate-binding protein
MTRPLLVRIVLLVVVLLASLYFIAFDVAGWRLGAQDYRVTVDLPAGGGIYTEAFVTYRGVTVGRVRTIEVNPGGVQVIAAIDPGVRIPADTEVDVRELTAAGEQYLDFVPSGPGAPYLHAGSVIPASRTTVPLPIEKVLSDTSRLLRSINPSQLDIVTGTLGNGLGGTGPALRDIVVAGQSLFDALQAASGATVETITAGHVVLQGAGRVDGAFGRFASGLRQLSAQLRSSNSDLAALLVNGDAAVSGTSRLLSQYSVSLRGLLAAAGTTSAVSLAEEPELRALLQVLPIFAGRIGSIVRGGNLHVQLEYNTDDPVCPYIPGALTPLPTQPTGGPALDRTCPLSTPGALARGGG